MLMFMRIVHIGKKARDDTWGYKLILWRRWHAERDRRTHYDAYRLLPEGIRFWLPRTQTTPR